MSKPWPPPSGRTIKPKFKVGQRVIIIKTNRKYRHLLHQEATIVKHGIIQGALAYFIDIKGENGKKLCGPAHAFRPIYDGNKPISWADMEDLWQPAGWKEAKSNA